MTVKFKFKTTVMCYHSSITSRIGYLKIKRDLKKIYIAVTQTQLKDELIAIDGNDCAFIINKLRYYFFSSLKSLISKRVLTKVESCAQNTWV